MTSNIFDVTGTMLGNRTVVYAHVDAVRPYGRTAEREKKWSPILHQYFTGTHPYFTGTHPYFTRTPVLHRYFIGTSAVLHRYFTKRLFL